MGEKAFMEGNEAVGWGAVNAGCLCFFGYPITPQNETTEWFAKNLPPRGGVFLQPHSESSVIGMLQGAAASGTRCMTSTSGLGWALMQEGMSHLAASELPIVIMVVQRGGPGAGSVTYSQMDYASLVHGGGPGGYRNIVLAPASVQETHDLTQLAFHLADKYRNPVLVISDGLVAKTYESIELRKLDFGPLPEKEWAVRGKARQSDGKPRFIHSTPGHFPMAQYTNYVAWLRHWNEKHEQMAATEVRSELHKVGDAELVLVAYGYAARVSKKAVEMARAEGRKVGLIRPISLWPFPSAEIKQAAIAGAKFLVVEDSLGLMVHDVRSAVEGHAEVHFLGMLDRDLPTAMGKLVSGRVFTEVKKLL